MVASSAGFCASASWTIASSAPTRVASPAASTRTTSRAPRFVAPAWTVSPSRTGTGTLSPVSTALSSVEVPASTTPSTGTSSPERTTTRSPAASAASGTSTAGASRPLPASRRANSRNATPRRLSARSSAARCAPRCTCRAPSSAATSIASESNQIGPAPRMVFQALAAKAAARAIATGRSMWTIPARSPASAVRKNGRAA